MLPEFSLFDKGQYNKSMHICTGMHSIKPQQTNHAISDHWVAFVCVEMWGVCILAQEFLYQYLVYITNAFSNRLCSPCVSVGRQRDRSAHHWMLSGRPWAAPSLISVSVCSRVADCWEEAEKEQQKESRHAEKKKNPQACYSLIIQHCFSLRLCICGYTPVDVQLQKSNMMFLHLFFCLDCDLYSFKSLD